jgi:hypothetical protein
MYVTFAKKRWMIILGLRKSATLIKQNTIVNSVFSIMHIVVAFVETYTFTWRNTKKTSQSIGGFMNAYIVQYLGIHKSINRSMSMSKLFDNSRAFYGETFTSAEPKEAYNDTTLGEVYIIHLDKPWITSDGRTVRHYIGFSKKTEKRLHHHRSGTGANFLRHALALGITFRLVVRFSGTKRDERRLKNIGHPDLYCPCCSPDKTRKFKPNVLPHEYHYKFVEL